MVHSSNYSLVIVKARTELWLPVKLTRPWSDACCHSSCECCTNSSPLIPKNAWHCHRINSHRGFSNSNSNCTGLALHQGIQTADFVREQHKDAYLLWQQQHDLDSQLTTDILNLQHTVSWLGDQVTVLATKSVLKCD